MMPAFAPRRRVPRFACVTLWTLWFMFQHSLDAQTTTIIEDISQRGTGGLSEVVETATAYAKSNDNKLKYKSYSNTDRQTFHETYKLNALSEDKKGKYLYGMALLSDDGCDVSINGKKILSMYTQKVGLPDFGNSFRVLDALLDPETEADIVVQYSNMKYTHTDERPDIDGCTLFVFLVAVDQLKLQKVGFGGSNIHVLCSDDGKRQYKDMQWVDFDLDGNPDLLPIDSNYSIAYTKKTRPSIKADFVIGHVPQNVVIKVRAAGMDGIKVPETKLSIDGHKATLPLTPAMDNWTSENSNPQPKNWPDMIKLYHKSDATAFALNWEYQLNDGDWNPLIVTKHQVYLTLAKPEVVKNRETLFYLACNKASGLDGSDGLQVVNRIYEEFQSLNIKSIDSQTGMPDGESCDFWGETIRANYILVDKDAVCKGWSDFLVETLAIHNIEAITRSITCINHISFNSNVADKNIMPYKYYLSPSPVPKYRECSITEYRQFEEIVDKLTKPCQGGNTIHIIWPGHEIVEFVSDGEKYYYDPSFGVAPVNGFQKFNDSMAGFGDGANYLWRSDGKSLDLRIKP